MNVIRNVIGKKDGVVSTRQGWNDINEKLTFYLHMTPSFFPITFLIIFML